MHLHTDGGFGVWGPGSARQLVRTHGGDFLSFVEQAMDGVCMYVCVYVCVCMCVYVWVGLLIFTLLITLPGPPGGARGRRDAAGWVFGPVPTRLCS